MTDAQLEDLFRSTRRHGSGLSVPPDATLDITRGEHYVDIVALASWRGHLEYVGLRISAHVPVRRPGEKPILSTRAFDERVRKAVVMAALAIIDAVKPPLRAV